MLKKINAEAFRWFIVCWTLYTVSKIADYWARAERWTGSPSEKVPELFFLAVAIVLLGWRFVFPAKAKKTATDPNPFTKDRFPFARYFSRLASALSTMALVLLIAFFCRDGLDNALLPIAILADHTGQYELAEQVFKYRYCREDNRVPFSAWKSSFSRLEDWEGRLSRNNAVAAVFGADSQEMANRLFHCARNRYMKTEDNSDGMLLWYHNALKLYRKNHMADGEVKAISDIVWVKDERNELLQCRPYFERVQKILPSCTKSSLFWTLPVLSSYADKIGLKEFIKALQSRDAELSKCQRSWEFPDLPLSFAFALALCVCTELGATLFRRLISILKYRKLQEKFNTVDTIELKLPILSQMIDLDLQLGNLKLADSNSLHLLKLAGDDRLQVPQLNSTQKTFWTKSVIIDHLTASGFIVLFLFSIYF